MLTKRYLIAPVIVLAAMGVLATPASARFTLHNSNDVTETDVVAGSELKTCGDHVSGRIGWSSFSTVGEGALPDAATSAASYELFVFTNGRGPADASPTFNDDGSTTYVYNGDGTAVQRVPFVTQPRLLVDPPIEQTSDGSTSIMYVYSRVTFSQTIAPAAPVGSTVYIKPIGGASFLVLDVVDCAPAPPVSVTASIDAQPGISPNYVAPSSSGPTLAILVKGSATLDVTKISTARVGAANPVSSGLFGFLSKPYDVDRDGKLDRLYFFRPNQTGLTCSSTSVVVAGTLQGATSWSGTDSVKPVFC